MSVLVGNPAPDFTAPAVLPSGEIVDDFTLAALKGSYVLLFFLAPGFYLRLSNRDRGP